MIVLKLIAYFDNFVNPAGAMVLPRPQPNINRRLTRAIAPESRARVILRPVDF
jgi:hypothetical protein